MVERFKNFISENNLIPAGSTVLLSVSGGIDSMVMAELFRAGGYKFAIAHCNFHLREEESDDDSLFVAEYAKQNNLTFHLEEFKTNDYAAHHKISVQMAARELRIAWLEKIVEKYGYQCYATAHHQDDQIETLLINLLRGCGISGLHGILPKKGRLVHPLLFTNRKEIEEYAMKNNISFREDSSNIRRDYLRNKIRHILVPALHEIEPSYRQVFQENIERFRQVESIYKKSIQSVTSSMISEKGEQVKISLKSITTLDPAESYLFEILSSYGFNFSDVKSILKSLNKQSGKTFLSGTHRLVKDRDYLIIEKRNDKVFNAQELLIEKDLKIVYDPIRLEFDHLTQGEEMPVNIDKNLAFIDNDKLSYPLILRKWKKGDHFYPLGMRGKKLISDFMIDKKLTVFEKEKLWLLLSGNQIVWIVGHRIDNRFKVTGKTKDIICIKAIC